MEHHFHGAETELHKSAGLNIVHVEHYPGQCIGVHAHDWPCLTLHRCGSYLEKGDGLDVAIDRPAAVYHLAGRAHANVIGPYGLDTVSILFDPAVLRRRITLPIKDGGCWIGGPIGRLASAAATELICGHTNPVEVLLALLHAASTTSTSRRTPAWLDCLNEKLASGMTSTADLAAQLDLHPAWLARAYLEATGESIQASVRRRRAEHALHMVRTTSVTFAAIAAEVGFCDQSHMVRAFQIMLGRTPTEIRAAAADRLLATRQAGPQEGLITDDSFTYY